MNYSVTEKQIKIYPCVFSDGLDKIDAGTSWMKCMKKCVFVELILS